MTSIVVPNKIIQTQPSINEKIWRLVKVFFLNLQVRVFFSNTFRTLNYLADVLQNVQQFLQCQALIQARTGTVFPN